jgi:hypothetical protein
MIQVSQTWCIAHEAHLLQSRLIVNSHSSKNRYSETIPIPVAIAAHEYQNINTQALKVSLAMLA